MEPMLKVTDLSVSYGHVEALRGVSIQVEQGQIVSIIGANGAGKSTLLRTISGLVKPLNGRVEFLGEPLPKKPNKIVAKGIVHVPEGRKTFSGLTIRDNLLVGGYLMSRPKILLLDEPSMGLAPIIVNQIYDLIRQIRDSGITVLLVEQNARKALGICDYAYVLENGKINLSGAGDELLRSDAVRKAYLGG